MKVGSRVRLKSNPGRIGVIIGGPTARAGRIKFRIQFPDGASWHGEPLIEEVGEVLSDPLEFLKKGQLGKAHDLRSNLTYLRLNGRLANLIYSMETTNTDFYPYQFKPVLNLLNSPSNSILIADEVGLGKTIEAGLIWTELRSRFDAKRLMVICPAMLCDKWSDELSNRFGVRSEVLGSGDTLKKLNNGKHEAFSVIASMQGLRPRKAWDDDKEPTMGASSELARFLEKIAYQEPLIDLLIIDEAHYMRNQDSMTARLGQLFRRVSQHTVLLSATPVNLKSRDLYQLLHLVDEDTFNQPRVFDDILKANEPLIRAKDAVLSNELSREEFINLMEKARDHYLLNRSKQLQELIESPPSNNQLRDNQFRSELADRLEKLNLLNHSITRTRKREVNEWRVTREAVSEYIPLSDIERVFYQKVTDVITEYGRERDIPNGFLLATPQRQIVSSMPAALKAWQDKKAQYAEFLYEDIGIEEVENIELGPLVQKLSSVSGELATYEDLYNADSKYFRLREMLLSYFKEHKNEKIILFSYFRPTLSYLHERLLKDGVVTTILMGGMKVNKQEFIQDFKEDRESKVLLSSEVASEGVDLQFCRVIINYDLPWNPMKVEQRIGRIDRIGQKSDKITIWNLLYEGTIDAKIHRRLFVRLGIFERSLGGLELVIGDEMKKLTSDLMSQNLSSEQQDERIGQTQQALENIKKHEEELEDQATNLIAHGGYILNQVKAAKDLNRSISAKDLYVYVRDFMDKHYPGCELRQVSERELLFDFKLSLEAKVDFNEFLKKESLYGQTRLAENNNRAISCKFKNKTIGQVAIGKPEVLSQFHPLIRFIGQATKNKNVVFHPAVSIKLDCAHYPELSKGVYCFYVQLWSITGLRDIEKLYFSVNSLVETGVEIDSVQAEKLITQATLFGKDWIEARNIIDLTLASQRVEVCMESAENEYDQYVRQVQNENEDRVALQERTLELHKKRQLEMLEGVKRGHELHGRKALIAATEGKIDKLCESIETKKIELNDRRNIKHHYKEICLGVILVG